MMSEQRQRRKGREVAKEKKENKCFDTLTTSFSKTTDDSRDPYQRPRNALIPRDQMKQMFQNVLDISKFQKCVEGPNEVPESEFN